MAISKLLLGKRVNKNGELVYGMQWEDDGLDYWSCVRDDGLVYHWNAVGYEYPIEENKYEVIDFVSPTGLVGSICASCDEPTFSNNEYLCKDCRRDP